MRYALREQVLQLRSKHGRDAHGRDIAVGGSLVLVEITRTRSP